MLTFIYIYIYESYNLQYYIFWMKFNEGKRNITQSSDMTADVP